MAEDTANSQLLSKATSPLSSSISPRVVQGNELHQRRGGTIISNSSLKLQICQTNSAVHVSGFHSRHKFAIPKKGNNVERAAIT